MNQVTWLFLGALAASCTGLTIRSQVDDILTGITGILLWSYWGLRATNVEIVRDGHPIITESYPGLAFFAAGMVGLHVLVLLLGAGQILDVRDRELTDEVRR